MSTPSRLKGEYRSAQHKGSPVTTPSRLKANTAMRSMEVAR